MTDQNTVVLVVGVIYVVGAGLLFAWAIVQRVRRLYETYGRRR